MITTMRLKTGDVLSRFPTCSLFLLDDETGVLVFQVALGEAEDKLKELHRVPKGSGIAGWVVKHGRSLRIGDAYAFVNQPALEVGGDFFDTFALADGRVAYLLGDISGKGVSAALLYTDGITEAIDPKGDLLGRDRLLEGLCLFSINVQKCIHKLMNQIQKVTRNEPQNDDITLLLLKRQP